MSRLRALIVSLAGLSIVSGPALAHHSNVAFEVTKVVTVKGAVKDLKWSNPHVWLYVTVTGSDGTPQDWAFEGRAPGILSRAGWSRNVFKPGEVVTIDMSPARDGSKTGMIGRVTKADGTILGNSPTE
jgi:Family of unknown function (DUF6152)